TSSHFLMFHFHYFTTHKFGEEHLQEKESDSDTDDDCNDPGGDIEPQRTVHRIHQLRKPTKPVVVYAPLSDVYPGPFYPNRLRPSSKLLSSSVALDGPNGGHGL